MQILEESESRMRYYVFSLHMHKNMVEEDIHNLFFIWYQHEGKVKQITVREKMVTDSLALLSKKAEKFHFKFYFCEFTS